MRKIFLIDKNEGVLHLIIYSIWWFGWSGAGIPQAWVGVHTTCLRLYAITLRNLSFFSTFRWPPLFLFLLLDKKEPKNQGRHHRSSPHSGRFPAMSAVPPRPAQSMIGVPTHEKLFFGRCCRLQQPCHANVGLCDGGHLWLLKPFFCRQGFTSPATATAVPLRGWATATSLPSQKRWLPRKAKKTERTERKCCGLKAILLQRTYYCQDIQTLSP